MTKSEFPISSLILFHRRKFVENKITSLCLIYLHTISLYPTRTVGPGVRERGGVELSGPYRHPPRVSMKEETKVKDRRRLPDLLEKEKSHNGTYRLNSGGNVLCHY